MDNGAQVRLVPMGEKHLDATRHWLSDPVLRNRIDCSKEPTDDENRAYWQARWCDNTRRDYAILDGKGKHIGNCGLLNLGRSNNTTELWIYLGERRGGGLGTATMKLLLRKAFDSLKLDGVYLRILLDNIPAQRCYQSFGFVEEDGRFQDATVKRDYTNSVWMSLTEELYRKRLGLSNIRGSQGT